jgi:hypothetical protein
LGGASRGSGIELYISLANYLAARGVNSANVDIKSDLPIDERVTYERVTSLLPPSSFSYQNSPVADQIEPGDYVLLTPYDSLDRRPEFSNSTRYRLLYESHAFIVPDLSIKSVLRPLLSQSGHFALTQSIDHNYHLYKRIQ